MDLVALLHRSFGTDDLAAIDPAVEAAGLDRLRLDFALERDRGRRFALWSLMHMLGVASDLDVAFKDAGDRDAARNFMDLVDRADAP